MRCYPPFSVADIPFALPSEHAARLVEVLDSEGKILRALEALGPLSGRDVALVGGGPLRAAQLAGLGAELLAVEDPDQPQDAGASPSVAAAVLGSLSDASADAVVSLWSAFRGVDPAEQAEADRVLRPDGRLLILHDYGRDDVSVLGDPGRPEYGPWSRRDGPFLTNGFKIRVIHCWWTFDSVEAAQALLGDAFGAPGAELGQRLKRPRLSHNVAIYHRSRSGTSG